MDLNLDKIETNNSNIELIKLDVLRNKIIEAFMEKLISFEEFNQNIDILTKRRNIIINEDTIKTR